MRRMRLRRVIWVNEVEETGFQYDLRIEASGAVRRGHLPQPGWEGRGGCLC